MPSNADRMRAGCTRGGKPRADRAQQFMPFAALTGYYQMIREMQRVVEPRRELTDEEAADLNRVLSRVRRGDLVRVRYYDRDCYTSRTDIVRQVDAALRQIRLKHLDIAFADVHSVEIVGATMDHA